MATFGEVLDNYVGVGGGYKCLVAGKVFGERPPPGAVEFAKDIIKQ